MPWKVQTDDKGSKILAMDSNNQPIWEENGQEMAIDWSRASGTIKNLMQESKTKREANEALTTKNAELTSQIETLKNNSNNDKNNNNNDSALLDAKLKEMKTTFDSELLKKDAELKTLLIGNKFASSTYIKDKIISPPDLIQLRFGNNFTVENGQVFAIDNSGQKLMSNKNIGEIAGFEESIEMIVDKYQYKDQILKGTQQSGGGLNSQDGLPSNVYVSDLSDDDKFKYMRKHGSKSYEKLLNKGNRPKG